MLDVQVQPHPDGIRCHQKIDIAVLVKFDLRIAGARAKRPHHHRTTALLAADQFGNGIDIFNRKADNCTAFRHPAYLFRTCMRQRRKTILFHKGHPRHHRGDRRAHGVRPQKQRFHQPARVDQTVGEHMATVRISAQLYFVHGHKIGTNVQRHRFDRADPIQRAVGHNAFFTCHQRHH